MKAAAVFVIAVALVGFDFAVIASRVQRRAAALANEVAVEAILLVLTLLCAAEARGGKSGKAPTIRHPLHQFVQSAILCATLYTQRFIRNSG